MMIHYTFLFLACVFIDRITKAWALKACVQEFAVTSWLSCSLAFNRGVALSLFHSNSSYIFTAVTFLVFMVMGAVVVHAYQRQQNEAIWGEILVLAGACSNVIDRFYYGAVIDFIGFCYGIFSWPLFNYADVCIVTGVMIMMYNVIKKEIV